MGVQIGVRIGHRAGGPVRIRCGGHALIQGTGVVVDAADLLLGRRGDRNGIAAAVDGGDRAEVHQHLVGTAEAVAFTDEVDGRRGVVGRVDSGRIAVVDRAGAVGGGHADDIQDIAGKAEDACSAVIQHGRTGRADRVSRHRADVTAVIQRIGRAAGDRAVFDRTDLRGHALIGKGQLAAAISRRREFGRAGIIANRVACSIRAGRCIDQHILRTGKGAVAQDVDHAQVAEGEGRVLRDRHVVHHADGRREAVLIMVLVRRDEQALIRIGLARQRIAGLAAVAVEDHGIALARPRAGGRKVRIGERPDIALVLQQIIAVASGADEVDAADTADDAALVHVADVGLHAPGLGRGVGVAGVSAGKVIA